MGDRCELEKRNTLHVQSELASTELALVDAQSRVDAALAAAVEFANDADTLREALVLAADDMGVMEAALLRAGSIPSDLRWGEDTGGREHSQLPACDAGIVTGKGEEEHMSVVA